MQENGFRVYLFNGPDAFNVHADAIRSTIVANTKDGCKTVLLVDEICPLSNFRTELWLSVLKPTSRLDDVILVAAGVSSVIDFSRLFDVRFDAQLLFYKDGSGDMEEAIYYWQTIAPPGIVSKEQVSEIVNFTRSHTGGHPYPFFKFCEAFFCDEGLADHVSNPQGFICSKVFFNSRIVQDCLARCNYQNIRISDMRKIIFNESGVEDSIQELSKAGFWNLEEKYFTSTLILNYYYNSPISGPSISSQFGFPAEIVNDPLVQRIYAGFCIFKEIDFMGAAPDARVSVENAISAKWATYLHAHMPTVFISSQVRAISEVVKPGAARHPQLTFY